MATTAASAIKKLTLRTGTEAALHNEQVTRMRVEALEAHAAKVGAVLGRGFWGRLKWVVLGR